MKKMPFCKNCGKYGHYKYQCWARPRKKSVVKSHKTAYNGTLGQKVGVLSSASNNVRKRAINELDRVVSQIVRRRYADKNGYVACYTCGKVFHWKEIDAGHYIKRGFQQTRWDLDNINPQCISCNRYLNGNYEVYTKKIMAELGKEAVMKMWDKAYSSRKIPTGELLEMLKGYKQMLMDIEKKDILV